MIFVISLAYLIRFVDGFVFNFSDSAEAPQKLTDQLFAIGNLSNEDYNYNTHEYTSYYEDSKENNKKIRNLASWFQPPRDQLMVKYLKLPVDHFNKNNNVKKWEMICVQNTQFWKTNAPIYLFVRGNTPMKYNELKEGLMYDLANETGGVMFTAEHRYYGKKDPYKDFSYLSSEQAIEDFNELVKHIKKYPKYNNSKVVLIGGGYGGSLAVWLKQTHPDAADVVVASSAPLLAKADFREYLMHIVNDFKNYMPPECSDKIRKQLDTYGICLNRSNPYACLKRNYLHLNICDPVKLRITENKQLFFFNEMSYYAGVVGRGVTEMSNVCKNLEKNARYRDSNNMFWDEKKFCDNYDLTLFIKNIKENPDYSHTKRWFYQSCNEFGFFPTTTSFPPPLNSYIPIEFYYKTCSQLFGPKFNKERINAGIKRTNERYGGLKPNVYNVVFIFGELDPWQQVGVVERYSDKTRAIVIPGVSYCKDLEPKKYNDGVALETARRRIKEYVKKIIGFKENGIRVKSTTNLGIKENNAVANITTTTIL